jgi:hypothetical protein
MKQLISVGRGIAAIILVVGLIAGAGCSPEPGGKADEDIKYGMTRAKRQRAFSELVAAADQQKAGDRAWREIRDGAWPGIQKQYAIDADTAERIMDEGFGSKWDQPAPSGTAAGRINRMTWIKKRTEERGLAAPQGAPPLAVAPAAQPEEPRPKKAKTRR